MVRPVQIHLYHTDRARIGVRHIQCAVIIPEGTAFTAPGVAVFIRVGAVWLPAKGIKRRCSSGAKIDEAVMTIIIAVRRLYK